MAAQSWDILKFCHTFQLCIQNEFPYFLCDIRCCQFWQPGDKMSHMFHHGKPRGSTGVISHEVVGHSLAFRVPAALALVSQLSYRADGLGHPSLALLFLMGQHLIQTSNVNSKNGRLPHVMVQTSLQMSEYTAESYLFYCFALNSCQTSTPFPIRNRYPFYGCTYITFIFVFISVVFINVVIIKIIQILSTLLKSIST